MNELQKYFADGIDGLMDETVLKVRERISGTVGWALFLAFVLSCGHRRLKALFVPEKMGEAEKAAPALMVETFPFMTDAEVAAAFKVFEELDAAEFFVAMQAVDGQRQARSLALFRKLIDEERVEAERVATAKAEQERKAAQARVKAADEEAARREHYRARSDEEMVRFINDDTAPRWKKPEDMDALVRDGVVFDDVNRRDIAVADACCVGLCVVTSWATGKRLGKKTGAKFNSFASTREFLEGRAFEARTICQLVAAQVAEVKNIDELDDLVAKAKADYEGNGCRAWPDGYRLGLLKSAANARAREFQLDKVIDLEARRFGSDGNRPKKTPEEIATAARERAEREAKRAERREADRQRTLTTKGSSHEVPLHAGAQRRRSKGGN